MRFLADDAAAGMHGSIAYAQLERTGVDRDRGFAPIGAADHLPGALGFAAGDHDADVVRLEQRHHLVGAGLELAGERLEAGDRERMRERLHPLIVPIIARGHLRVLGAPFDQLFLGVEAEVDEQPGDDRVEHQQRSLVVVDRGQAANHLLLPGRARPEAGRGVAAAEEDADRAVGRLKALLHVERLPRAALFSFRKGGAVVQRVAERAHVGVAGH
jgi:hypothetical protein